MANTTKATRKMTATTGMYGSHIAEARGWETARSYRVYLSAMLGVFSWLGVAPPG